MSDLVGNPEDRFSHVAAHLLPIVLVLYPWSGGSIQILSELVDCYIVSNKEIETATLHAKNDRCYRFVFLHPLFFYLMLT